ncbi:hypothetical protein WJX72_000527 [[Myrmecia] bisecta]|uniref:F-box domain-containing protein n=1 Tax=[Myrmecia] bisecta TaxID=41462 RepID=A0AAW1R4K2_9CHLO
MASRTTVSSGLEAGGAMKKQTQDSFMALDGHLMSLLVAALPDKASKASFRLVCKRWCDAHDAGVIAICNFLPTPWAGVVHNRPAVPVKTTGFEGPEYEKACATCGACP